MKKLHLITLFLMVWLLSLTTVFGQTYKEDENEQGEEVQRISTTQEDLNLLGIINTPNPRNQQLQGNQVFLRQVGDYNRTAIINSTEASEIKIRQNGDNNLTGLFYIAKTAYADLFQNGDFNTIKDFTYNPSADVSLELQQQGDGLYFERFGTNSITESLKFKQTEASPTIIIRSFE
ncbi:MAG: hypothetical protein ACKVJF_09020 [Flavobacteriales bacterium]